MYDEVDDVVLELPGVCSICQRRPAAETRGGREVCFHCRDKIAGQGVRAETTFDMAGEAQRELARRELARRRLIEYTRYTLSDYDAVWLHFDLAARFERFVRRVVAKQSPRLMLWVPPRHGKTELYSKRGVTWALGHHPWLRFICATHTDRLALDNSSDVLDVMRSHEHQVLFPGSSLQADAQGKMGWRTKGGGAYKPVGVGAGISGYGGHIFNIDDPHKDQEAYSQAKRDSVWRWYKSSARTRLLPGGGVLVIQTRWVADDLSGRLLEEEGRIEEGGAWEVVEYPFEAIEDEYRLPTGRIINVPHPKAKPLRKKGEVLHPARYPMRAVEDIKKDPVVYEALYQQNPRGGDAGHFTEEMFEISECKMADIPARLTKYQAWDTAQSIQQTNDWSVGITGALDEANDILWIVDVKRDRFQPNDLIDALIDTWLEQNKPDMVGVEKTQFVVGLKVALEMELTRREIFDFPLFEMEHGNKDKAMRALPIKSRMRRGQVRIPTDAPWYEEFRQELLDAFGGKHDDQVDAFAYLGQLMLDMQGPAAPPKPKPKVSPWRQRKDVQALIKGRPARKRNWRTA